MNLSNLKTHRKTLLEMEEQFDSEVRKCAVRCPSAVLAKLFKLRELNREQTRALCNTSLLSYHSSYSEHLRTFTTEYSKSTSCDAICKP
jgi:hypothetical protein